MDIIPTLTMYRDTSKEFATKYMWWFFLIQKEPLPEHMIGCDPEFFLDKHFEMQNGTPGAITPEAMAEYKRCFCQADAIHASCEDYRAAATLISRWTKHDKAGHKISAPLLALWGAKEVVGHLWDVLATWRAKATSVSGKALDCGHLLPEEQPAEVLAELQQFFRG